MTSKSDQIEWRRSAILDLASQGYSERETAVKLHVSKTTVHKDMAFLTKQAQENLQYHIHKVVPIEYTKSLIGLRQLLRKVIEISESTEDKRLKLTAISVAAQINKDIMDLCSNAGIINEAMEFIDKRKSEIAALETKEITTATVKDVEIILSQTR